MRLNTLLIFCTLPMALASTNLNAQIPADVMDFSFWKITLPLDEDKNGSIDEISVSGIQNYSHPDYFYVDDNGFVVFASPNKAPTTSNSTNTRSELRQMFRGTNTSIGTHQRENNFAISAHPQARRFADVGGQLEATLRVLNVATRANLPDKNPAFSVVVGQIHALKNESQIRSGSGFGHGNEPLKIYYKKWPGHEKGSVFWTYERNLAQADADRKDIAFPVWGNTWDDPADPGEEGIALGELFNYNVNVYGSMMHLTFRTADPTRTKTFEIDLSKGVDEKDNPEGYAQDAMYFKAGAYNQCSASEAEGFWYPACMGTGDWETDKANGDFVAVAFRRISLARGFDPK